MPIKWLSVSVFAWASVIASHDEVCAAVILANQAVPNRFPWPAQTHGKRQQGKFCGLMRVLCQQSLIATDAREVIDVAKLCHPNRGMEQLVSFNLFRRAESQFHVRAMHGITRLKCHHTAPTDPGEFDPQFSRS